MGVKKMGKQPFGMKPKQGKFMVVNIFSMNFLVVNIRVTDYEMIIVQ